MPLKVKGDFKNDEEFIKYMKERLRQRTNLKWRIEHGQLESNPPHKKYRKYQKKK